MRKSNYYVRRMPGLYLRYDGDDYPLVSASLSSQVGGYVFTVGLLPSRNIQKVIYGEKGFLHIDNYSIEGRLIHSAPLSNGMAYTTQLVFKDPFSLMHASYLISSPLPNETSKSILDKLHGANVMIEAMNSGKFSGLLDAYNSAKEALSKKTSSSAEESETEVASETGKAIKSLGSVGSPGAILSSILEAIKIVSGVKNVSIPNINFIPSVKSINIVTNFIMQTLKTDMGIINLGKLFGDWMAILGMQLIVNPWTRKAYILPLDVFPDSIKQNNIYSNISDISYDVYGADYPYTASIGSAPGIMGIMSGSDSNVFTLRNKNTKVGKITEFSIDIDRIISANNIFESLTNTNDNAKSMSSLMESVGTNTLLKHTLSSHIIRIRSEVPYYGMMAGYGARISVGGDFRGLVQSYRMDFNPGSIETSVVIAYARDKSVEISKPSTLGLYATADVEREYKTIISSVKSDQGTRSENNSSASYKSDNGSKT